MTEIKEQKVPDHVAIFNFDGGVRDFFVGQALAEPMQKGTNQVTFHTEMIKNVQMSYDHNSQLFSRTWMNQIVPFIASVSSMGIGARSTSEERIIKAQDLLILQSSTDLVLSKEDISLVGQMPVCSEFSDGCKTEMKEAVEL